MAVVLVHAAEGWHVMDSGVLFFSLIFFFLSHTERRIPHSGRPYQRGRLRA